MSTTQGLSLRENADPIGQASAQVPWHGHPAHVASDAHGRDARATSPTCCDSAGYDAAGDMTSDGTHTYQWDAKGQLISVDNGSTATYMYDALGQRIRKVVGSGTLDTQYDIEGRPVAYGNTVPSFVTWQDFLYAGDRFAGYYGAGTRFVHPDNIGSTTHTTDHTGTEIQDELYYPFGGRWAVHLLEDERFAGLGRRDAESNLDPTPNRMFTSGLGRWLTPDPLGGDVTNPQSLNRYAYVLNNPTTLTDPSGLGACDAFEPWNCPPTCDPFDSGDCQCNPNDGGICVQYCYELGTCNGRNGGGGGGSSGGGGAPAPPGPPGAGQPPLGGGNSYSPLYPCLTGDQIARLSSDLLRLAGEAIGVKLSGGGNGNPIVGGAWNVYQNSEFYVDPEVVKAAEPADPVERKGGWQNQLVLPLPKDSVPGPGNVMHILFNTGGTNNQGQVAVTAIKIHADIAGQGDLKNDIPHLVFDLGLARLSSRLGSGCAVKFY